MTYTTRHDRPGTGKFANDPMMWRARQLVTAGYSAADIAAWIGCPFYLAEAAFLEVYPELNAQQRARERLAA